MKTSKEMHEGKEGNLNKKEFKIRGEQKDV